MSVNFFDYIICYLTIKVHIGMYSEKATKFCEISTLLLSVCTVSKVEISQNFVAFSEYKKFTNWDINFCEDGSILKISSEIYPN